MLSLPLPLLLLIPLPFVNLAYRALSTLTRQCSGLHRAAAYLINTRPSPAVDPSLCFSLAAPPARDSSPGLSVDTDNCYQLCRPASSPLPLSPSRRAMN
ncbi:hypothetical protein M440DRAFT_1032076 [Trichoderma longibrachiatum ATCC 18648]|uniref:Secreted protein n=1 Tax=Trichoderma longibrachiatum ATCC 18648 TaxID=983965 RepID=A0A2T4BZE0_TRILO|nr:hypothetical protein M440DRAFT_1032076 [Trichoderma longibrachiatum ATCC 18648]